MQVSVEDKKEGLDRQVSVTLPAEDFSKAYKAEASSLSKKVRLDGFRRGHIPASVLTQRFGERMLFDAGNSLVEKSLDAALKATGLRIAGHPYNLQLPHKVPSAGEDFVYKLTVDTWPEVELKPFEDLRVKVLKKEISDADVDEVIEFLRRRKSKWEAKADLCAGENCMVVIDFVAKTDDGQEIKGMSAKDLPLYLYNSREEEFIFKTLVEQVKGHKAGDKITARVRLLQDEARVELRGISATLDITLKSVSDATLPELNDEFVKPFGLGDTVDAFKTALRTEMQKELSGIKSSDKFQLLSLKLHDQDGEIEVPFSSYNLEKIKNIKCELGDADIDRMIESLRWQQSKWQVKDDFAVAKGTLVKFDYTVSVDGKELPEEGAKDAEVVVEGGMDMVQGLSDQLKDHKAGDKFTLKAKLPETWKNASVRGKDADLGISIVSVSESVLPEVNADFIKVYGVTDGSVDTFRAVLRSNMERELNNALYTRRKAMLNTAVKYQYGCFEVPRSVLQTYIESLSKNLEKYYLDRGVRKEDLKSADIANAAYYIALDQLRFNVILRKVAEQYKISDVSTEEIQKRVELNASMYDLPDEYKKQVLGDEKLTRGIKDTLVDEKLVDFILSKASSEDVTLSYAQLCGSGR